MIGKGAFGEVYHGLLSDVVHRGDDLPVAVKVNITGILHWAILICNLRPQAIACTCLVFSAKNKTLSPLKNSTIE